MATLQHAEFIEQRTGAPREIEIPAPTAWPLVLAFGFSLVFVGLLTNISVSILGAMLTLIGCVGWFREVFPTEHEEVVTVFPAQTAFTTMRRAVDRIPLAPDQVRAWLPVETYPISAGVKGGLAGSVAMAALACLYGLVKTGSIWYPINLLAAVVYAPSEVPPTSQLNSFHPVLFLIAVVLHFVTSILVGLLYGAMLPMFARRPMVLGGLIAPALVVGPALLNPGTSQSRTGKPYRLVLVYRIADRFWRRRRSRRHAAIARQNPRKHAFRVACRH